METWDRDINLKHGTKMNFKTWEINDTIDWGIPRQKRNENDPREVHNFRSQAEDSEWEKGRWKENVSEVEEKQ